MKLDGSTAVKIFATGTSQFFSNVIAEGNLTVNGNLTVSGFYPVKPYIGLRVVAGVVSDNDGYVPTANITVTQAATNAYIVTFTPAHPLGADFLVFAKAHN